VSQALVLLVVGLITLPASDPSARALLERAIDLMGGRAALSGVERVRLEMITQWQGPSWDPRDYASTVASYERHEDERDYRSGSWRNTRHMPMPNGEWRTLTDLVSDSVAVRDVGRGWAPLNVAYVDERDELFRYTPDRLLLALAESPQLRLRGDTMIGGEAHARLDGVLDTQPVTLLMRRATGLPAVLLFTASHPNDFGLVPWGTMDVEVRYTAWAPVTPAITLPRQWEIRRVGRSYKRLTVQRMEVNPTLPADHFAIGDSLRREFVRSARRPMHDLPLDSVRTHEQRIVEFRTPGYPTGAVRIGGQWLLLESGHAELSTTRALAWLATNGEGPIGGALLGLIRAGNGGAVELRRRGVPLYVAQGSVPILRKVLANHGVAVTGYRIVDTPQRHRLGYEEIFLVPVHLANTSGAAMLWVPSLRWLYVTEAVTPLDMRLAVEKARALGWRPAFVGSGRTVWEAAPAVR